MFTMNYTLSNEYVTETVVSLHTIHTYRPGSDEKYNYYKNCYEKLTMFVNLL